MAQKVGQGDARLPQHGLQGANPDVGMKDNRHCPARVGVVERAMTPLAMHRLEAKADQGGGDAVPGNVAGRPQPTTAKEASW